MHIVTSLEKQRGRMRMVVDEEHAIMVPLSLFRERPFEVNEQIDLEEYDNWLMVRQYRHALDKAANYLSMQARTSKEVHQYLLRYGYLESTAEMVVYKLQKLKYLNDDEFARQWVESRSHKALGKHRIKQELLKKGIDRNMAESALDTIDEEGMAERAYALAIKLAHRYRDDEPRRAMQKLMQAIVRRGFDWDDARQAAESALRDLYTEE